MKEIKSINKLIISKIIEIMFSIAFIVVSIPLITNLNNSNALKEAAAYDKISYNSLKIDNPINYDMYPMTNEDAINNLIPCKLTISNESNTSEKYTLILKISKKSTMDYKYLNISVDNEIYSLEELKYDEDDYNIIFKLEEGILVANNKTYLTKIWLNENANNDQQATTLSYSFDLLKKN